MKMLVLHGSNRVNGNTERVTRIFLHEFAARCRERSIELAIDERRLGRPALEFCLGCRACFDRGEEACPLKDGVLAIREAMREADILLLTSPVYAGDCSGVVKNWIDRTAFVCHRPEFAGKRAYLLLTTGSISSMGHAFATMGTAISTWGFKIAGKSEYVCGALTDAATLKAKFGKRIAREADRLASRSFDRRKMTPSFLALLTFKLQQDGWSKADADSVDLRYWRSTGWLEKGRTFYLAHRANPIKVALARMLGAVAAHLFG